MSKIKKSIVIVMAFMMLMLSFASFGGIKEAQADSTHPYTIYYFSDYYPTLNYTKLNNSLAAILD